MKNLVLACLFDALMCLPAFATGKIIPLAGGDHGKGFAPLPIDAGSIHLCGGEVSVQGVTFAADSGQGVLPGGAFTAGSITPQSLGFGAKPSPNDIHLAGLLQTFRWVNRGAFTFSNPASAAEYRFTGLNKGRNYQLDLFTVADANPRKTAIQVTGAETMQDTVLTRITPCIVQYALKPDATGSIAVRYGFGGGKGPADAGLLSAIAITTDFVRQTPSIFVDQTRKSLTVTTVRNTVRLQPWSAGTVRVEAAPGGSIPGKQSFAVIAQPDASAWTISEQPETLELSGPRMKASVDRRTGLVSFYTKDGKPLLSQQAWDMKPARNAARDGLDIRASFVRQSGERYFGGGVIGDNFRQTQTEIPMENDYLEMHIPVLYSDLGYGMFWDNASRGKLRMTPDSLGWESSAGDLADFYVMAGPEADSVVAEYRCLTGSVPLFPEWAYGFWFSRNKFDTQQQILDAAAKFRQEHIPIDLLVQDYFYWKPDHGDDGANWGSHEFNTTRYPDPKGMISQLHEQDHIHFMAVIWAKFDPATAHGQELEKAGALFPAGDWAAARLRYYDPFNPKAREIYGRQVMDSLLSLGLDAFWMDGAEPEIDLNRFATFETAVGPCSRVMDAFPLLHTASVYNAQRAATSQKRVVLLPRSSWAGEQRNAVCSWTSDIHQDWKTLAWQIEGLQNYSICGLPYVTTDVGGYSPTPESDTELFVRWFQWGAFCPIFRVHGMSRPFPWQYGPVAEAILRKFDLLRYRLLPYIYSQAARVTFGSGTLMRPLVMDFRDDPQAVAQWDEFLFGPSLLVCPIYKRAGTEPAQREIYLPGRAGWYDFWTGKRLVGGTRLSVEVPLDTMPLYVRAGSILPMGPEVQFAAESPSAPLEIRVYRGADGRCAIYEDAGDDYSYEKGQHLVIPIIWSEAGKTLTFGAAEGGFAGMPRSSTFRIVWVDEQHGIGETPAEGAGTMLTYSGREISIQAP